MDTPAWSDSAERLHRELDAGVALTYVELCRRLALSDRHIRRAISELRASGVSVLSKGRPVRFQIPAADRRAIRVDASLSVDEVTALELAAQIAESALAATPLARDLSAAIERLFSATLGSIFAADVEALRTQWYFTDAPSAPIDATVFARLRQAIEERRSVVIDYFSAHSGTSSTDRRIDPYCIALRSGSWILIAWCHDRNEIREFNLVDTLRVELCEPDVDARAFFETVTRFDPDDYFRDRFRHLGGVTVYLVELLVESTHVAYFRRKTYHPTQQIALRSDGRAIVSYEVEGLDEIRSFAQSWGPAVTVLAPEELVERMRRDAETLARRYGTGRMPFSHSNEATP